MVESLKNIVECIISEDNSICTLVHENGSKIRYYNQEAKEVYRNINGN